MHKICSAGIFTSGKDGASRQEQSPDPPGSCHCNHRATRLWQNRRTTRCFPFASCATMGLPGLVPGNSAGLPWLQHSLSAAVRLFALPGCAGPLGTTVTPRESP